MVRLSMALCVVMVAVLGMTSAADEIIVGTKIAATDAKKVVERSSGYSPQIHAAPAQYHAAPVQAQTHGQDRVYPSYGENHGSGLGSQSYHPEYASKGYEKVQNYKHKHEHSHYHKHQHEHNHKHKHGHGHNHEHKHGHGHSHEHKHGHNHDNKHGHYHNHEHKHGHGHGHNHKHGHQHGHKHDHKHYESYQKQPSYAHSSSSGY